jgi:glycosyltransferase involved in cell wall biosynthesis
MALNTSRKKILFTSSWFPSKSNGSLGNFVQRHAEAVALKNDVHVLYVSSMKDLKTIFHIENFEEMGVKITIVYFKSSRAWNPLRKIRAFQKGWNYLANNLKLRFDLVHHNVIWKDGWQPLYLNLRYGIPYIITEHWTGFDQKARGKASLLLKCMCSLFASRAKVICPVTENLADNMKAMGMNGVYRVVPNVVDTSLFDLTPKQSDSVRFLHVSSLVDQQKNISGILRAWKKAVEMDNSIHLTIGGDGPWDPYQELIRVLQIPKASITYFGEKTWSEIAGLMKDSHCLLMFSNYENLPCVIVEALASGMHIVSTRVGGIAEHINDERGLLIAPLDEQALVDAILAYSQEYRYNERSELRDYAVDHFSKESIATAFDKIYTDVLTQKS